MKCPTHGRELEIEFGSMGGYVCLVEGCDFKTTKDEMTRAAMDLQMPAQKTNGGHS